MIHGRALLLWAAALAPSLGAAADADTSVPLEPAATRDDERAMTFEVGTGLEYDSEVAVLELDTAANAGDMAALVDFGAGYHRLAEGKLDLSAGYNFSQSLHDDFDEFDIRVHRGSGTFGYDLGRVDVGVTLQYADAALHGDEFMTYAQTSPYLSKLVGTRLFLRFAYAYTEKRFATDALRNANTDAVSGDAYVFLNGLRRYLVLGMRYDNEDAVAREFDFAGYRLSAQLAQRLMAKKRELTLRTYLRYEARDYEGVTPSIGAPRDEDRVQLEATLDVPLTKHVVARLGYKRADNRSNLPSVDFDENVLSASLTTTF
ncbi:MAG TPA: surface lipoprotein assembly modifier [Gammaproteobacteria bacterium]|nr:surface lipoprotein assembly modifier [Gammaproteobacteria bacterium]